jgi:hypothetical protein
MTIFRFNLIRRSSLLSLSQGGNVMRANFSEYRWLCGRGGKKRQNGGQSAKQMAANISLTPSFAYLLAGSLPQSARSRKTEYIYNLFTSYFLFISFFLSTSYLIFHFFLLSLSFLSFVFQEMSIYFHAPKLCFFSCETIFNFFSYSDLIFTFIFLSVSSVFYPVTSNYTHSNDPKDERSYSSFCFLLCLNFRKVL